MRWAVLCAVVLWGCGDDAPMTSRDAAGVDNTVVDVTATDAPIDAPADALVCPAAVAGTLGGTCTMDSQCDSVTNAADGLCLRGLQGSVTWPAAGFCVSKVDTCTDDASCGTGGQCITLTGAMLKFCVPTCSNAACECPADQLCASSFIGDPFAAGKTACMPGLAAANDGSACDDFGDCDQGSVCRRDVEFPGGYCQRIGCTIGNDATCAGADGHCIDLAVAESTPVMGSGCVDACTNDNECRVADAYRCFDAGATIGKFCRHPHVGDACVIDGDCGDAATWECKTGVGFPGGMCTFQTECT
ncbi:MAG TPA: hypothetical protein VIV11_15625, partial [Kofleriaceae bacterium]